MNVGDPVTVRSRPHDPLEIEMLLHPHAIIIAVEPGPEYFVGHPPAPGRFGPYAAERLIVGWPGYR